MRFSRRSVSLIRTFTQSPFGNGELSGRLPGQDFDDCQSYRGSCFLDLFFAQPRGDADLERRSYCPFLFFESTVQHRGHALEACDQDVRQKALRVSAKNIGIR